MINKAKNLENEIKIDKEGNWFYNGAQIINRNIFLLFCNGLEKDGKGGYLLRIDKETSPVIVESTPFVVVDAVTLKSLLQFSVLEGRFPARFLRKAYYRIAECFEQDEDERFFLKLADKKIYVNHE